VYWPAVTVRAAGAENCQVSVVSSRPLACGVAADESAVKSSPGARRAVVVEDRDAASGTLPGLATV
jgi:hypothetical protein